MMFSHTPRKIPPKQRQAHRREAPCPVPASSLAEVELPQLNYLPDATELWRDHKLSTRMEVDREFGPLIVVQPKSGPVGEVHWLNRKAWELKNDRNMDICFIADMESGVLKEIEAGVDHERGIMIAPLAQLDDLSRMHHSMLHELVHAENDDPRVTFLYNARTSIPVELRRQTARKVLGNSFYSAEMFDIFTGAYGRQFEQKEVDAHMIECRQILEELKELFKGRITDSVSPEELLLLAEDVLTALAETLFPADLIIATQEHALGRFLRSKITLLNDEEKGLSEVLGLRGKKVKALRSDFTIRFNTEDLIMWAQEQRKDDDELVERLLDLTGNPAPATAGWAFMVWTGCQLEKLEACRLWIDALLSQMPVGKLCAEIWAMSSRAFDDEGGLLITPDVLESEWGELCEKIQRSLAGWEKDSVHQSRNP